MADNKKKKKRITLYSIFNPEGSGKELTKEEAKMPRNFINFFKFFGRNFNLLFALNIIYVFGNFPLFFGLCGLAGYLNIRSTVPVSELFAPLYGTMRFGSSSPVSAALFGVHGIQKTVNIPTAGTIILLCLTSLVLFTFGLVNIGNAYVMRNMVKGEPVSVWSDFIYAVKKNFRQGLVLGLIDILILAMTAYDIYFYNINATSLTLYSIFIGILFTIILVYFIMRFYTYVLAVTFNLSVFKILKNALIFTMLGLKRNILALLGIIAVTVVHIGLFLEINSLGIIAPFIVSFAACSFMGVYAAYPKIKEIMIDPYYESDKPGAKLKAADAGNDAEKEDMV